jgi:hypothetical protein
MSNTRDRTAISKRGTIYSCNVTRENNVEIARTGGFSWWQLVIHIFFWRDKPQWAWTFSFMRILLVDHTQQRTTVGRTPLDE